MADDDDRDDMDDDDDDGDVDVKDKPAPKAAAKPIAKAASKKASKAALPPVDENIALLREIRDLSKLAHERQDRYLWMLLPVIALLLVIAIFQAVKL